MQNYNQFNNFESVSIKVASPEKILEWSHGEVTRPETLNYRTGRSERSGLFDEKIFGPEKDYECYCGKYKGVRYKGIVCEKCGVELTRAIVRRDRMGHIELASPVSHIWFLRSMPSRLGLVLGMSSADLEKVVYFAGYIITRVFDDEKNRILKDLDSEFKSKVKSASDEKTKDALKEKLIEAKKEIESVELGVVLDEISYHSFSMKYSTLFEAGIGAEAIYDICKNLNLEKLLETLVEKATNASPIERQKINKRVTIVRGMIKADIRPEWMFITQIPVIPPGIRPMVALDGGRFASSDVNDLYRRVINRNNRLKKLIDIMAPEVILRNEKRILQEAVDALIDSSIRHTTASAGAMNASQRRELKSLADNLKGKRGIFRQNLLGKRVDYSGRSVIVVGPDLALDQCGLPKHMALELFRPFIISELINRELAYNIRGANRLIEDTIPEVWAILEEVIMDKHVLLNRAPTLHRLSIQAFRPVLIEGNAIQVHPLVCTAFNADFDGDQMAVHVPLGEEAQLEAKEIMASSKNLLKPGSGNFVVSIDKLDIILGCYWVTKIMEGKKGEGKIFGSPSDAILASDFDEVDLRAKIKVSVSNPVKFPSIKGTELIETSVGRLLFDEIMPVDYPFVNKELSRKVMGPIIDDLMNRYGMDALPNILDKIKKFGFKFAARSGTTWGLDDVKVPVEKDQIISDAKKQTFEIQTQFDDGLLSNDERYRKNITIWHDAKNKVEKTIPNSLEKDGSVYDLVYSGARGSFSQLTQMTGMKGLIQNTAGETLEFPIIASNKEGFSPVEYFITTHGSRKGLADTALNTAKAGYLTRKLFVVAQDIIVNEVDCGTKDGIYISRISASGIETPFSKSLNGRVLADKVLDKDDNELFGANSLLSKKDALKIEESGLKIAKVRSPLTCKSKKGICATCYGHDLGTNKLVGLGEAVGTIAAQAIGEPGTQLTMRTFHAGGTASVGGDITQGLPRVEELFEKRAPKNSAMISKNDCMVLEIKEEDGEKVIITLAEVPTKSSKSAETEYRFPTNRSVLVKKGDAVKKGDLMTDGSVNLDDLFKYAGKEKTLDYIVREVSGPYELQGESVSRKHIEVIIRQMFSRKRVTEPGDTKLSKGDMVDQQTLDEANEDAKLQEGEGAKSENLILGISEVSLSRRSFLAAASFQYTTRILVGSAVKGSIDPLHGLMENVILGRLIPAGTGFKGGPKGEMVANLQEKMRQVDEEAKMTLEMEGGQNL